MTLNPITLIDGYKTDHRRQYPPNTTRVYSNWTPRESRIEGQTKVVFFGLQYFLDRYLDGKTGEFSRFFYTPKSIVAERYARRMNGYLGPNTIGTRHIEMLHDLGYLPLEFRAIPEGTKVPLRVPMLTVENTHDDFAWLVNYFETLLSNVLWLPCTSATTALRMRALLDDAALRTGSAPEFVDWQGHDFSMRGMAGPEAAAMSGAGHLLYFTGTDTIPAIDLIEQHYGPVPDDYLIGGSVAATEHSVMCAGGEISETETFERLLTLYPEGIVSVVSDTWDLWKVLTDILPKLQERIMARPGKLVIRPDSGDPVAIICGDPSAPLDHPAHKGVVELLWETFGGTITSSGHRLLDGHVGVIYGDSITYGRAQAITDNLAAKGFASGNMVFGVGSYCVSPETPILCADLVWRPAGSIVAGQEILAFDEDPEFGDDKKAARRYRTATIKSNNPARKPCWRVFTDIGDPVTASEDHPWLVLVKNRTTKNMLSSDERMRAGSFPRGSGLAWKRTSELEPGDKIAFLAKPWVKEETRDAGWLEGMFDGEGSLSRSTMTQVRIPAWKVNISQNPGPVMERLRLELRERGFNFYENRRDCPQLVLTGGWVEVLRFLGTIAPVRLLEKLPKILADMPALKQNFTYKLAKVSAVEPVGMHEVASIETSSGTFITGGYLSHNTYQFTTRDVYGFAMKATWVKVDGEGHDIFKDPITDSGMKKSAKGRLAVVLDDKGELSLINQATPEQEASSLLRPVWKDGSFLDRETFDVIRERARS